MFFQDYPRFSETSTTGPGNRLELRHRAIIEPNKDILAGARVLDIASHDGRWSFAALKAGAAHVVGIEARQELVDNANATFTEYGISPDSYQFIRGDVHGEMANPALKVDVVMCLGFLYHTLRYPELFSAIRRLDPRHIILDTVVAKDKRPIIALNRNQTDGEGAAAEDPYTHEGMALVGRPSLSALRFMLDVYGYEVAEVFNWRKMLRGIEGKTDGSKDYQEGKRVTLVARPVTTA